MNFVLIPDIGKLGNFRFLNLGPDSDDITTGRRSGISQFINNLNTVSWTTIYGLKHIFLA